MSTTSTSDYVLGRSPEEYARLTLQSRILRPYTERYFRAAGLAPGMRVLDIGSGMGDVAMLAADIVGPGGHVVGVDVDSAVLDHARQRALAHGCAPWVRFEAADLRQYATDERFDALVGRYVLLYLPDAAATVKQLLKSVKPGGIVVFHDLDMSDATPSYPPSPLWDAAYRAVRETFELGGSPLNGGRKLADIFLRAGLPFPTIAMEGVVGGGAGSYLYAWVANTVASVAPRRAALGHPLPPSLAPLETLAARIEEEAVRLGSQGSSPVQYGAWARKP